MEKPKPRFASSASPSANRFFFFIFGFKKKTNEGTSIWRSNVTLLFSLTCRVWFLYAQSPHLACFSSTNSSLNSFTSLNPFETFFRPLQNDPILAVTTGESMRIPGLTPSFPVIYRKCCHDAQQAVHTKSSLLWMSEENFHKELSRITFYDYIIYSLYTKL